MTGKIAAFYGADVKENNGGVIDTLANKTEVTVVEAFGKPAFAKGEYVKVSANGVEGWVDANQVHVDYA